MRAPRTIPLIALLAIAACREAQPVVEELAGGIVPTGSTPSADAAPEHEPSADRGRNLVARYECARCHEVAGVPHLDMMKRCVGCHESIGSGRFPEASDAVIAEWQGRMHSLPTAPSLIVSGPLLSARWVASFLREPHDLRPDLEASMPRLPIDEREAQDIAAFLTEPDGGLGSGESPLDPSRVEHGAQLYDAKQCGACHAFSGSGTPPIARDASALGAILAPDLRWTRDRVRPDRLAGWLRAPRSGRSAMPDFDLTVAESEALASFVIHTPLKARPPIAVPDRLPVLDRPVAYDEVAERVFRKICWHCHAQPDLARGDGGPGMSGGMGFPPRHLDLSTYESINSGYLDDEGELTSLFSTTPDGTPRIVAVLLARQREIVGQPGPLRGMPLGFPPLSAEDIQLVESWVAQGRPR